MLKDSSLLADVPVSRAFCKLALPAIAAQLINILYNLVDKMFIGRIPDVGKQALAGVGVTAPVILAISAFAALVSMGGAPKASIFMGKGDHEQAEKVMGSCTWLLIMLSVVLTGIMMIFGKSILLVFGASDDTITYAADYMNIYCLGTLFTQLTLGLNAFITAQGKTLISMCNVAVGAVTNIVLDAVFINGIGMGVKGAALATVISQGVSACFVIRYLITGRSSLHLRLRNIRFDGQLIWPCILLGTSPALMQLTENMVAISFNTSLQRYGGSFHEYPHKRYAVCHAAPAGSGAGSTAAVKLQSGCKEYCPGKENISAAAGMLHQRFLSHLAALYDEAGSGCLHFYQRYRLDRLYQYEYEGVPGDAFHLWSTGRLPVQLCGVESGV